MSFILRFLPRLFQLLASLKVTVVLFVLSSLLVFFGTLAQKGQGVWTVVDNYFYSWLVKVEVKYLLEFGKIFLGVRPDATSAAWFPFPAGKLLGWAMVANLTAAHVLLFAKLVSGLRKQAARSRSTAAEIGLLLLKRSGIIVLHAGVLAMLLGEYVTREFAVEQQMLIEEGKSANYAYETRNFEIAFVDRTDPTVDKVAVLPSRKLSDAVEARDRARRYGLPLPSTRFTHDALPVDVEVLEYFPNSKVEAVSDALQNVLRKALPNATDPARKEVTDDAAVLLQTFQEATAKAPNDAPLPLFEKAVADAAAKGFRTPAGKEALARIEAGVIELKQQQQATAGIGLTQVATPEPEVSGVDVSQRVDLPSCYVTLYDKPTGNALGIYLLSVELSHYRGMAPQEVPGQPAAVELRPARHYKAYTLHLHDFKFDRYIGTETAKNYSSDVRLEDPALGQDRDVTIRMNEPLRHRGDAIFQSSFTPDEKATILQVVSNPGWQIPYISCVLVMAGMGLHFCIKLVQFLARSLTTAKPAPAANKPAPTGVDLTARGLSPFARYGVPAVGAVLALVVLIGAAWPRKPTKDRLDLQKIATLPVVDGGRVKPLDTVARVDLRLITHAEEFPDENGKKRSAIQWFLDVATSTPDRADGPAALPIFRIENDDVRSLLKLPGGKGLRYSIAEMKGQFASFDAEAKKAAEVPDKDRTLFQSKLLELRKHVEIYLRVAFGDTPLLLPSEGEKGWRKVAEAEQESRRSEMESLERAMPRIRERLTAAGIPPGLKDLTEEQRAVLDRIGREEMAKEPTPAADPLLAGWQKVLTAYSDGKPAEFETAVSEYRKLVIERVPVADVRRAEMETFLNQPGLYYWCTLLYGAAGAASLVGFVLLLLAPKASQTLRPRGVLVAGRHVRGPHADAPRPDVPDGPPAGVRDEPVLVGSRHRLDGAPPVPHPGSGGANRVWQPGGVGAGVRHLHHRPQPGCQRRYPGDDAGGARHQLLALTHVTTVTFGYAATYVAGVLGLLYVVLYVFPEQAVLRQKVVVGSGVHTLNHDLGKLLGTVTYAVICFATLLSFVGTVLGGIWADQSWGRFWGWDPKENGAVLIVLWNALILHARWGGMVKERGMAVLSVVGIMITTWSWFGTNQLGVGLLAYGFNNGLVMLCDGVWLGSLAAVLVGVLAWQWVYRGGEPPQARRV